MYTSDLTSFIVAISVLEHSSLTFLFGVENLRFTSSASYLVICSGCSNKARCYGTLLFFFVNSSPETIVTYSATKSLSFVHVTRIEILRNFSFETEMGKTPVLAYHFAVTSTLLAE